MGSFGFRLEDRSRYTEVFLRTKADPITNPFRAIAEGVVEREVHDPDEVNWPG